MRRALPDGYSIRTLPRQFMDPEIAPFWRDEQIAGGQNPSIYGYFSTVRKMRRICRLHAKNRIDR